MNKTLREVARRQLERDNESLAHAVSERGRILDDQRRNEHAIEVLQGRIRDLQEYLDTPSDDHCAEWRTTS